MRGIPAVSPCSHLLARSRHMLTSAQLRTGSSGCSPPPAPLWEPLGDAGRWDPLTHPAAPAPGAWFVSVLHSLRTLHPALILPCTLCSDFPMQPPPTPAPCIHPAPRVHHTPCAPRAPSSHLYTTAPAPALQLIQQCLVSPPCCPGVVGLHMELGGGTHIADQPDVLPAGCIADLVHCC